MRNAYKLSIVLFSICFYSYSQEISHEKVKGEFFTAVYFGSAVLEVEDSFKVNALITGGIIGKEFIITNKCALLTGIELIRIQTDLPGFNQQLYLTNNHIKVPVLFHIAHDLKESTSIYVDGGIYGSYLISSKLENISLDEENKESGLGFNFGLQANIGIKHRFDEKFSFNIGLISMGDLFQSYEDKYPEYKIRDVYGIQLGVGVQYIESNF